MRMLRKQQIRNQYTNQDKTDLNKPNMRSDRRQNVHQRHMKERSSAECERISQERRRNVGGGEKDENGRENGGKRRCCREPANVLESYDYNKR